MLGDITILITGHYRLTKFLRAISHDVPSWFCCTAACVQAPDVDLGRNSSHGNLAVGFGREV